MAKGKSKSGPTDGPSIRAYFNGFCSSFNTLMRGRCTPAEGESVLLFFTRYSENRTLTEFYLADQETADPDARVGALVALNAAYRMAGQLVEREAAFYGVPVVPFVAMRRATLEAWKNPRQVCAGLVADVADPPGYQDALAELSAKLAAAKLAAASTPALAPNAASKGAGDSDTDRAMARKRATIKWLAEAMTLISTRPFMSDADVAKTVKKAPSTLSRNKTYQRAAKAARETIRIPKGSKTAEGSIEAIDE